MTAELRTRRHPCPWCAAPDAWPDGCSESAAVPDGVRYCLPTIERRCMRGDHRRCAVGACTMSTRWHDEIRAAGIEAARVAGDSWAVVSIIPGAVVIAGTADRFDEAGQVRATLLYNAGRAADDAEGHGLVYLVRRCDGGLL